jgi:hypothetical protein
MKNANENLKELKEGLGFFFALQDGTTEATADGKVDGGDVRVLFPIFQAAKDGFEGLGNPIERWKALSSEEREQLFDYVRERFDLPNDILEILIEDTLLAIVDVVRISKRWVKFVK